MKPTGLVVAAHSPLEGDAVCRFLERCPDLEVLAEVRSAEEFDTTVRRHNPDVVLLSQRLPRLGDMVEAVKDSSVPPERFVCMTASDLKGRSIQLALRQLGVRSVLAGEFGPEALLRAIALARPRPSVVCVRGLTGGAGQTTTAFGILLGLCRLGHGVRVVDNGPRRDLTAVLARCPWLDPLLLGGVDSKHAPCTVVDGPVDRQDVREVVVVPRTFGAMLALAQRLPSDTVLVDNAGVGGRKESAPAAFRMVRFRVPLLEEPPRSPNDRRIAFLATMARRLATGGSDPGERPRIPGLLHRLQP